MTTYQIIRGTIILVVLGGLAVAGTIYWLRHSRDEPRVLITKWLISVPVIVLALLSVKIAGPLGPFIIVGCGILLSIMWTPNLGAWLIKPLTSALDGGDEEPEQRPFYAIARVLRNKGKHLEAIAAVRQQLERFPNDFEGVLLLAGLQAENLNDLPAAEWTLNQFCEQPDRPAPQVAAALYQLADWHLKYAQDPDAARRAFEQIIRRYPDTERAAQAAQRIAHLPKREYLLSTHDREVMEVEPAPKNLGLLRGRTPSPQPVESDPEQLAAEYVAHLEQHPLDSEAREKLALIYADHFGRLDLATDQIEQLVRAHPQMHKQVARWLNLLADLQVRGDAGYDLARETLQRIIDQFPDLAVAETARHRINHLRLELKAKTKNQAVALGSYEQNLGLKRRR